MNTLAFFNIYLDKIKKLHNNPIAIIVNDYNSIILVIESHLITIYVLINNEVVSTIKIHPNKQNVDYSTDAVIFKDNFLIYIKDRDLWLYFNLEKRQWQVLHFYNIILDIDILY